jgi:hypothetical protein
MSNTPAGQAASAAGARTGANRPNTRKKITSSFEFSFSILGKKSNPVTVRNR